MPPSCKRRRCARNAPKEAPTVAGANIAAPKKTELSRYVPVNFDSLRLYPMPELSHESSTNTDMIRSAVDVIFRELRTPSTGSPGSFCLQYPMFFEDIDEQSHATHILKVTAYFHQTLLSKCCQTVVQCCMHGDGISWPMVTTLKAPADKYVSISAPAQLELLGRDNDALSHLDHFNITAAQIEHYIAGDDGCSPLRDYLNDHVIQQRSAVILTPCGFHPKDSHVVGKSKSGMDIRRWTWVVYVVPFQNGDPCVYMMPADLQKFQRRFMRALYNREHDRLWFTASSLGFNYYNHFPLSLVPASFHTTAPIDTLDACNIPTKFYSLNDADNDVFLTMGHSYLLQRQIVHIRTWPATHPTFAVYASTANETEWNSPPPHELLQALRADSSIRKIQNGGLMLSVVVIGGELLSLRAAWTFLGNSLLLVVPDHLRGRWSEIDSLIAFDRPCRSVNGSKTANVGFPMVVHVLSTAMCDGLGTYVTFDIMHSETPLGI